MNGKLVLLESGRSVYTQLEYEVGSTSKSLALSDDGDRMNGWMSADKNLVNVQQPAS